MAVQEQAQRQPAAAICARDDDDRNRAPDAATEAEHAGSHRQQRRLQIIAQFTGTGYRHGGRSTFRARKYHAYLQTLRRV